MSDNPYNFTKQSTQTIAVVHNEHPSFVLLSLMVSFASQNISESNLVNFPSSRSPLTWSAKAIESPALPIVIVPRCATTETPAASRIKLPIISRYTPSHLNTQTTNILSTKYAKMTLINNMDGGIKMCITTVDHHVLSFWSSDNPYDPPIKAHTGVVGHIVLVYKVITLLSELDLFGIRPHGVCTNHRLAEVGIDERTAGGVNTFQLTRWYNVQTLNREEKIAWALLTV